MPTFASRGRRFGGLVALVAALTVLAATAFAVPARQGAVSNAAPTYAWDGGPANGTGQGVAAVRCTPAIYECEDTLVEVKDPGDLFAEIKGGDGANDLDVAIYKSDANGTTASEPGADSPDAEDVSVGKDAKTTLKKVQPGFYVVRVRIFDGVQATWKGSATLKTPPPPAPASTPAPTPATPPQQGAPPQNTKPSAKERRNACKKKAKKIKNKKKRAKAMKRCNKIR